jgi:hypothetical protein
MDCGWQNSEQAANNYLELQKHPASNVDCIQHAAQRQTSGIRAVLFPFAMMISLPMTS